MTCINGGIWGILASYGVYLSYYISNETFPGTSDLAYTFVGGINFAAAMLVAPFANILIKKFGTNKPMYAGCMKSPLSTSKAAANKTRHPLVGGVHRSILCEGVLAALPHSRAFDRGCRRVDLASRGSSPRSMVEFDLTTVGPF